MAKRIAEILFKDEPAGLLQETASGGTRFTYAPDWQLPIACCFPVSRREHDWPQGLHPFFQHICPEGWLRERQARVGHIAQEDDLGLLLRYGADCIGAVSVRPEVSGAVGQEPVAELTANPGRTISGIQRKLLVVKDGDTFHAASANGPAPFIAKFNSQAIPTLVRNENLSMRWAKAVLGEKEVCSFVLGQVTDLNEPALILTRFDRDKAGNKLRLEDFAQILCKPRGADYGGKYQSSYEEVAAVIKEHSARPAIDLAQFFRRLVLFVLVGNCDGHLKNFSLLETPTGLRLSPAYDIVNSAVYDGYDQRLALAICGNYVQLDLVTRPLLVAFALSIGLPQSAIDKIFDDLRRLTQRAAPLLTPPEAESPDGFIHRFAEIVSRGCQRTL